MLYHISNLLILDKPTATGVPQMAISLIGAAGASGAIGGDKPSLQGSKPPVPQTKALAVAKIRAAIAQVVLLFLLYFIMRYFLINHKMSYF